MSKRCWGFALVLGTFAVSLAGQPAVVPAAKPPGWVFDQAGLLGPAEAAELQQLGDAVHARNGAALAVLTVQSIGDADPLAYAAGVADRWGLGDAERDNGILIFVAAGDRRMAIALGRGIDSDAEVAKSGRILEEEMKARFRRGEMGPGIVAAARACAAEFFGVGPGALPAEAPEPAVPAAKPPAPWRWRFPSLLEIFWGCAALVAFAAAGYGLRGWWLRHRPRRCPDCKSPMVRLGEDEDDRHLAPGEVAEEKVGSRDYDVWACPDCGRVEKLQYRGSTWTHVRCGKCQHVTASRVSSVVQAATLDATGQVEVTERCVACGHEAITAKTIPRLGTYSPSGSSSHRPGGASARRSFGFSRSSGKRGGGSFSGRGSSGSW